MNELTYLQQVASLAGLQVCPGQGPWNRKSGCAAGTRDGYITVVGFNRTRQGTSVVVLIRFKKAPQAETLKASLKQSAVFPKGQGRLAEVGADFIRWEWTFS
jgi:hypothetical protein